MSFKDFFFILYSHGRGGVCVLWMLLFFFFFIFTCLYKTDEFRLVTNVWTPRKTILVATFWERALKVIYSWIRSPEVNSVWTLLFNVSFFIYCMLTCMIWQTLTAEENNYVYKHLVVCWKMPFFITLEFYVNSMKSSFITPPRYHRGDMFSLHFVCVCQLL